MKTRRLIANLLLVALSALMLAGCGKYIGEAKASEIALADAGFTKQDVRDFECDLDKKLIGAAKYEVSFDVGIDDYEYDIDAATGEILSFKLD